MQLAAGPRTAATHPPPPVPPRPIRREDSDHPAAPARPSARPPCPTRQAPVPPRDARPWRPLQPLGDHQGPTARRNNIQRQDWLEAGVRYSSTKITLPAAGGEPIGPTNAERAPASRRPPLVTMGRTVNGGSDAVPTLPLLNLGAVGARERSAVEAAEQQQRHHRRLCGGFADLNFPIIISKHGRRAMSSLQGLPPLPRSLSGFQLNGTGGDGPPAHSIRPGSARSQIAQLTSATNYGQSPSSRLASPAPRQLTTLDTQLALLRREMFGLRQLDLSLLSQLWSLNESIQDFRQLLQDQEDRAPSASPSSEDGDDSSYSGPCSQPPPPPPARRNAPAHQALVSRHQFLHHQQQQQQPRTARPARIAHNRPASSDDTPSSEEYGAV